VLAKGLSSFEGIEEPTVIYHPAKKTFTTGDTFVNIKEVAPGTIRFALRYDPGWWDGDRSTENRDRQRAEVKGLGPHQKAGETFKYSMEFRSNPEFVGTDRFCHIFQLKATDGDNGAPLVTLSLKEGRELGQLQLWSGRGGERAARQFKLQPGQWHRAEILITISDSEHGAVLASINGDALDGLRDVGVYRPQATDYRPKWGFYRGTARSIHVGEDWIEHRNIAAKKL
jgi:hypothetical protein